MDTPVPLPEKPILTIRPSSGWAALNLHEIVQFRDLLYSLAQRDVKLRYRQTALGASWVILQPLLAAGIFSFVFGSVAKMKSDGIPYFVFSFSGLLGWNVFSSTVAKAGSSMVGNAHLVSKVFFPRLVLPLSTTASTLIDFMVALPVMVVLLLIYHITPGAGVLLLPICLLLIMMMAAGLGLFSAALMVSYRDVQYVMPVLVSLLQWASPVAYSASNLSPRQHAVYFLNPLSGLIEATRWSILNRGPIHWPALAYGAVFAIVIFMAGAVAFKRMERKFADVI